MLHVACPLRPVTSSAIARAIFSPPWAELGYDDPSEYEGFGNGRKVITSADVHHGLAVMASDQPERFAEVMSGTGDADTADVFLQWRPVRQGGLRLIKPGKR
jgi:hypothetical protein